MKIHGHARIELRDQAGNVEVIEHDNIITNWLQKLLQTDINGGIEFGRVFPIKDWFGGCFLVSDEVQPNAEMTMLPSNAHITAHAGGEAYAGTDTTAGTPNLIESGEVPNGYKFVWDWATSAGNGDIQTICLTHKKLGAMVNTNRVNDGSAVVPLGVVYSQTVMNKQVEEVDAMTASCVLFDYIRNLGYQLKIEQGATGDAITVIEKRVPMCNVGILDDFLYPHIETTRRVSVTRPISNKKLISLHLDENYIYIVEIVSTSSIALYKISRADFTCTEQTLSWSGVSFDMTQNGSATDERSTLLNRVERCPIVGDYIYILDSTKTSYCKCNLTNLADASIIDTTFTADSGDATQGHIVMPNGNFVGLTRCVRGDVVYPFDLSRTELIWGDNSKFNGGQCLNNAIALVTLGADTSYGGGNALGISTAIGEMISTINPLNEVVTKTADRTMKLIYTIRVEV